MCSELVSTCRSRPARCGHICSVVVPPSIMMPSPGSHRAAAAWPMASFSVRFRPIALFKGRSGKLQRAVRLSVPLGDRACAAMDPDEAAFAFKPREVAADRGRRRIQPRFEVAIGDEARGAHDPEDQLLAFGIVHRAWVPPL